MAAAGGESISDQSWAFPWLPDPEARAAIIEQTSYEADWEYIPDTAVPSGEVERLSKGSDGDVPGNDADGSDPLTVTAFVHKRGGLGSPGVHMCRDAAGGVFVFKPVGKPASMLFAIRIAEEAGVPVPRTVFLATADPRCTALENRVKAAAEALAYTTDGTMYVDPCFRKSSGVAVMAHTAPPSRKLSYVDMAAADRLLGVSGLETFSIYDGVEREIDRLFRNGCLTSDGASHLAGFGAMLVLDCVINNFDRAPLIWRNQGNPNNVLVSDDVGFVAIDFEVCAIRNESMASGYYDKVRNVTAEAVAALRIIERVDEEDAWSDEHNEALVEALPSFGNVRHFIWTYTTYNIGTCGLVAMARGFVAAAQRLVDWRDSQDGGDLAAAFEATLGMAYQGTADDPSPGEGNVLAFVTACIGALADGLSTGDE